MDLRELIDRAAARQGTQTALAAELGATKQRLYEWRTGARPCPIEVQARIAQLAGEDAQAWTWEVVRSKLGKLAKSTATHGAAVMLICGGIVGAVSVGGAGECATMYIMLT
jgi:hypothetical protein